MEIEKAKNITDIALTEVSRELELTPEYKGMLEHIGNRLPAIKKDSENFYKSSSQFKNVSLDVTELTPIGSLKHILAVIDQTKRALEESYISLKRKQIELRIKTAEYDSETDLDKKDIIFTDIVEINVYINNLENVIKGALRKMSFFTTQHEAVLEKIGKKEITEEDYEINESRHHVMTAMKQALNAARTRGGMIDEGNYIYLFDMGINGAVAQAEIIAYLQAEQEMLSNGQDPTHEFTIKWLELCADKFADSGKKFAQLRGLIPLDEKSLIKEASHDQESY
ncbi:MAG: hypothetical protein FJ356_05955 [Thaumarchaeota archaeon]|nr:hypothetical protein [Nitrososphaerota archaeon]